MSSTTVRDLGVVYAGWGGSYLATKTVVEHLPPMLSMGARYALAAAVAGAWAATSAQAPAQERVGVLRTGLFGIVLLGGGTGLLALGAAHVGSGMAALLFASSPVWASLGARVVGRQARPRIAGLAFAFAGLALLAGPEVSGEPAAYAAIIAGALCWGLGSGAAPALIHDLSTPRSVAIQTAFTACALLTIGLLAGEDLEPFKSAPASAYVALALVAIVSSVVTYAAYQRLLRTTATQVVMTHAYVNPLVAVVAGTLVLGERLSGVQLAGATLVVTAAAIQVSTGRLPAEAAPR